MKQASLRLSLLVCALLAIFSVQALAQDATIVGTVTDPSGAAVPNATITSTNENTGTTRTVKTSGLGQYVLPSLQIGNYTVRCEATGFKKGEHKNIALQVDDRQRIDFALQVGSSQESVTVEAAAIAVQSESGEVSDMITASKVSQIATNGRSFYYLAAMTAGASSAMPDNQVPIPVGGNAAISFNGMRDAHNLYLIDGGENLDRGGAGTISVMPSTDSIAEFRQLTSNYSAEYGLSSGATMTMVFKSGTKDFHAEGWEFCRNEALDANRFFANRSGTARPVDRLNVYGFNVGGPVFIPKVYNKDKNKTFFFYNMEWRKALNGGALNTNVPPTSAYTGNLGYLLNGARGSNTIQLKVPTADQLSQSQITRFANAGLSPGQAIPNNVIPSSLIDPNATALLNAKLFPADNGINNGTYRFVGGNNAPINVREEIVRADHHFTDKFWVFGHYVAEQIDQVYGTTMWSGDNVPSASNTFGNPSYSAVVRSTYAISPTVLNELAFNYNGNRINILPGPTAIVGRPTGFNVPELFAGNALNRIPSINLGNETGTNYTLNWLPWTNKADDYQIRDDFSWTHGQHQFKFGASWAIYKKIQTYFANTQGGYTFNGSYTGSDFADFLLGMASNYNEDAYQGAGHWNNQSWALYAQDTWKVNRRLTLNLGLRWDGIPHTYEASNQHSNFYPRLYDPAKRAILTANGTIDPSSPGLGTSPLAPMAGLQLYMNGIGIAGQNGIPAGIVQNHWATFGPRIGFAYDVTGRGKTVLRGGFGMMYERIQGNDMYNGATNAPWGATVGFQNVLLSNPKQSIKTGQALANPINVTNVTGIQETDYKSPVSNQYSFGVQQEIRPGSVVSISYVGNQNRHQNAYTELNLPSPSLLPGLIQGTIAGGRNTVVPYQGWGSLRMSGNSENSHYNGLQVNLHSQVKKDLTLQVAYTFSKAMDPTNGNGGAGDMNNVSNPYDRSYDNGASPLDRRQIFLTNFIYDLPVFRGSNHSRALRTTLGGWQVSGIVTLQTGLPLQMGVAGGQGGQGLPNATNRPDSKGSVSYPHTLAQWFNPAGFATPAMGAWGNLERNSVYGPGRHNWNVSLFKDFLLSESRGSRLQIRVETFNLFNHTQWSNISTNVGAGDFGQVTNTQNPRNIQLGAKLSF